MSSTYSHSETHLDHKELKKPDRLLTALTAFFNNLKTNSRHLAIAGATLLLLIALGSFLVSRRDVRSAEARNALFLADKSLEKELKALVPPAQPVKVSKDSKDSKETKEAEPNIETVLYKKLDVDARLPETVSKLKEVIDHFSNTRAGYEALLNLGRLYYDHGDPAKALPWLMRALGSAPSTFEKAMISLSIGHAQEDLGEYQKAIPDYEAAAKVDNKAVKGDALLSLARVQELLKDTAKAQKIYDQIISEMADTSYAKSAQLQKSQLE